MNKVKFYNHVLYSIFVDELTKRGINWKCNHKYNWFKFKTYLEVEICDRQNGETLAQS